MPPRLSAMFSNISAPIIRPILAAITLILLVSVQSLEAQTPARYSLPRTPPAQASPSTRAVGAVSAPSKQRKKTASAIPIYISFHWHMHQPIYWPYESVVQTDQNARYPYSVTSIHDSRTGPYTVWPSTAVQMGISAGMPHFGAQVSFSGSLMENLNNLEAAGDGNFQNWKSSWINMRSQKTSLGNPRLDMVGFGYFHPMMGLIDPYDIRKQIEMHKQIFAANLGGTYSKGIFPPENAFTPREIPSLVAEGLQWVLVDNIHFDRACAGYPYNTGGNLYEPNKADARNPNPNDWVQLNDLWAPTQNSARWGRQPHYVAYTDPNTGATSKMIAVPADRYMGTEDARGGFGALSYDAVMSQLSSYNTDPKHPILIVLAHDGDNYGGGSESYYNSNFQSFVQWLQANPSRFVCTTVQDYLDMFPPDTNDVIHVEDGSWSGAANGDPQFLEWDGDPVSGYSPDRNSWGVVTATRNYVQTANQIDSTSSNTKNAWKYLLVSESSDYWYWDFSQGGIWDSHPTRGCNQAVQYAQLVTSGGTDLTPPSIFIPQRSPYNPGGTQWGVLQPSNFTVWTYVYDLSGLSSVELDYRTDNDGVLSTENDTYAGGGGMSAWTTMAMSDTAITPETNPLPTVKAHQYSGQVAGLNNVMVDYYVQAVDGRGNVARSPIQHVWVGVNNSGGGGGSGGSSVVSWTPANPTVADSIRITVTNAAQAGKLHWGINNAGSSWQEPNSAYWPQLSSLFNGTGPAVESGMTGPDTAGNLTIALGPFDNPVQSIQSVAFDIHYTDGSYNNNSGQDYHITVSGGPQITSFVMDGALDTSARALASNGGIDLYTAWNGTEFYAATEAAPSEGGDMFIFITDSLKGSVAAPWAKSGTVAAWKAALANESTNNYSGWYNGGGTQFTGGATNATGSYLEGTVNLQTVFGYVPTKLYLAVGKYTTTDGGGLIAQDPSGNGDNDLGSSEFALYQFSAPPSAPAAPTLLAPADNASGQPLTMLFSWAADSGAIYYHVQLAADSTFASTFAFNDSSVTDTQRTVFGLGQLQKYFWRVQAKNAAGVSAWSSHRSFTTLLLAPAAPVPASPSAGALLTADSVTLTWHPLHNAISAYRLLVAEDTSFALPFVDTTLADTAVAVDGLAWDTTFWWKVAAHNASGWGPFDGARGFEPVHQTAVTLLVPVQALWNMVSNPLITSSDSAAGLFGGATLTSNAFAFAPPSGYVAGASLVPGAGYWLKVADSMSVSISGDQIFADTIPVARGWNLIGSISSPVDSAGISTLPPGMPTSSLFGYSRGYSPVTTVIPGKAYWIKVSADGSVVLRSGGTNAAMKKEVMPVASNKK